MKENDTAILVGTNKRISFPLLSISNASNYTCMATVESNYLEEAIHISTDTFEVNFQGIIIVISMALCMDIYSIFVENPHSTTSSFYHCLAE